MSEFKDAKKNSQYEMVALLKNVIMRKLIKIIF